MKAVSHLNKEVRYFLWIHKLIPHGPFLSVASTSLTPDSNVSVVEGENLELRVTVEFNLVLESIIWEKDSVMLESGSDRVTIVNSDLDPPNANSTLTQTDISRLSDGGSYVMTATNRAGSATTTFIVDVLCKNFHYFPSYVLYHV